MRTLACLVTAAVTLAPGALSQAPPVVDTLAIRAHTHFLAHDLLRGRGTGSEGARIGALYISSACRALGLRPIGNDFLLPLPLEAATVGTGTGLVAQSADARIAFAFPGDVLPNAGSAATFVDFDAPAVFVGAEADVGRGQWGDAEVRGAVAVSWDPLGAAAVDSLRVRGAVAVVHLLGSPEQYALYAQSRGRDRYYHRDPTVRSSFLPSLPSMLAGPRVARALLADISAGATLPAPQALRWRLAGHFDLARRRVQEANVACLDPGRGPSADTVVAFSAHYDHLGVSTPDESGDSIYNGFSDNAAGVAMLLAIAARPGRGAGSRYGRLFLFFGGEERGLLGSDYFVAQPAWSLDRIRALINLDAGAPPAPPVSWRLAGVDSTGLGAIALHVAAERGWAATTSPARANSDYFPFSREGVETMFIVPGPEPYEGMSEDASRTLRSRWDRYHQAGDAWAEDFPFAGLARYAEYALAVADALDRRP